MFHSPFIFVSYEILYINVGKKHNFVFNGISFLLQL